MADRARNRHRPAPRRLVRVLAIETSSRVGSVAIGTRDALVASATFQADQHHGVELLPTVAALCERANWLPGSIEECYVSTGPGSFTGLRIGIALARTLAWSAGVRLVGVATVEVIAANALELPSAPENLAVLLDAKRGRVYGAILRLTQEGYEVTEGPLETGPAALLQAARRPLAVTGEGIPYHQAAIDAAGVDVLPRDLWTPRAQKVHLLGAVLARRGRFTEPRQLVPTYIRLPAPLEKLQGVTPRGSSTSPPDG